MLTTPEDTSRREAEAKCMMLLSGCSHHRRTFSLRMLSLLSTPFLKYLHLLLRDMVPPQQEGSIIVDDDELELEEDPQLDAHIRAREESFALQTRQDLEDDEVDDDNTEVDYPEYWHCPCGFTVSDQDAVKYIKNAVCPTCDKSLHKISTAWLCSCGYTYEDMCDNVSPVYLCPHCNQTLEFQSGSLGEDTSLHTSGLSETPNPLFARKDLSGPCVD